MCASCFTVHLLAHIATDNDWTTLPPPLGGRLLASQQMCPTSKFSMLGVPLTWGGDAVLSNVFYQFPTKIIDFV